VFTNQEFALSYAHRGWAVFPLVPFRKEPLTKHGFKDATTDRDKIIEWWQVNPEAGIGMAVGHASNFLILEIEVSQGINGWDTIKKYKDINTDDIISTVGLTTPSENQQWFFQMPKERIKSLKNALGKGLHIIGNGDYVILPPTELKPYNRYKDKGKYEWSEEQIDIWGDFEEFPGILKQIVLDKLELQKKTSFEIPEKLDSTIGKDELFKIACRGRHVGMSEVEVYNSVLEVNKRCEEPLEKDEILKLCRSACSYEQEDSNLYWDKNQYGHYKPTYNNCLNYLETDTVLQGLFKYNLFSSQVEVVKKAYWMDYGDCPKNVDDNDIYYIKKHFRQKGFQPSSLMILEAIHSISLDNTYHPVLNYLRGLKWDGKNRLDTWLHDYMGSENNEYSRFVGKMMLVAACARVDKPGCKYDYVIILEGAQGLKKSMAVEALGAPWFKAISLTDNRDRDTIQKMQGAWIVEVPEMTCFKRQELDSLKAFITTQVDHSRFAYGRTDKKYPRQCIFVGTINPEVIGYLTDKTGNRRFLPVDIGEINVAKIRIDKDMLFAEAWALYKKGFPLYIKDKKILNLALEEQGKREIQDGWTNEILNYLQNPSVERITAIEIYVKALEGKKERFNPFIGRRIANIMKYLGYNQSLRTTDKKQRARYYIIHEEEPISESPAWEEKNG